FGETRKLLDYGFNDFKDTEIFPAGYQKEDQKTVPVSTGKEAEVEVAISEGFTSYIEEGTEEDYELVYQLDEELIDEDGAFQAPLKKGHKIGVAELQLDHGGNDAYSKDDGARATVVVVAQEDVAKKDWFRLALDGLGSCFKGLWPKIADLF